MLEKELVKRICAQVKSCCGCESCAIKKRTPEENLKKFYSIYNYAGSRKQELLIEIKNLYPDIPDLKIKTKKETESTQKETESTKKEGK